MEVVHARCAGLDISNRDARVCVRVADAGRRKTVETVTTWGSMTSQILALREHLIAERITCAVMAATGDYWKAFLLPVGERGIRGAPDGRGGCRRRRGHGDRVDEDDVDWSAEHHPEREPREGCQHAATVVEKTVWQPDYYYYCLDRDACGLTVAEFLRRRESRSCISEQPRS